MAKSDKSSKQSNWSAPYPGTRYNPPAPSKDPGQATHQDNQRAKELIASDFSNLRGGKPTIDRR